MDNNIIPEWITPTLFENVLHETVEEFQEILEFKVFPALAPGENYASVVLKVQIEVLLKNQSTQMKSFILKVAHDSELYRNELSKWHMFTVESGMYSTIKLEFEKLYADAGLEVSFGAKPYKLPIEEDREYLLLEDLTTRGFKNAKRQNCLDMDHCKSVLKKLAQFHAASAVRVQQKGNFDKSFQCGMLNNDAIDMCRTMFDGSIAQLVKALKNVENLQKYLQQVETLSTNFADKLFARAALDSNEFNVLNHGDCWSNNIMFQYDKDGKLLETYFVDLQMPRYGTPAQDLHYFIISSAKVEIKVEKFDYMIKYYFDNLVDHLNLLNYTKPKPSLRDIHSALIKYGIWAVLTIVIVMAAALCDPTNAANIDNFVADSEEGQKFKEILYSNDRFLAHLNVVLPWLYHRGAFE